MNRTPVDNIQLWDAEYMALLQFTAQFFLLILELQARDEATRNRNNN